MVVQLVYPERWERLPAQKRYSILSDASHKRGMRKFLYELAEEKEKVGKELLLGKRCPAEQVALFDCLCDGLLFWDDLGVPTRQRVTRGQMEMWLEVDDKPSFLEFEVDLH